MRVPECLRIFWGLIGSTLLLSNPNSFSPQRVVRFRVVAAAIYIVLAEISPFEIFVPPAGLVACRVCDLNTETSQVRADALKAGTRRPNRRLRRLKAPVRRSCTFSRQEGRPTVLPKPFLRGYLTVTPRLPQGYFTVYPTIASRLPHGYVLTSRFCASSMPP